MNKPHIRVNIARISQYLFFVLFLVLFVLTEYRGKDEISVAVNSLFRANPLVVVTFLLAEKTMILLLVPGILMLIFSSLLGRFFCGWICPLGTLIDMATKRIEKKGVLRFLKGRLKYYLLFTLLFAALFNVNVAGVLDPIAILVRALTFAVYPLLGFSVRSGWTGLYELIGERREAVQFLYGFLNTYLLPFRETFYPLAFLSLFLLLVILFLERYERRNWCRNLCPLGTLLGLASRLSPLRRVPAKLCFDCGKCRDLCPTSFDEEFLQQPDCILCMDCKLKCQFQRVQWKIGRSKRSRGTEVAGAPLVSRRLFLGSLLSGFTLSRVFAFSKPSETERVLRPPGAQNEEALLKKCVRCGECMKVCLRSALYPAVLQSGLAGLYSPVLIPRLGYCEYNCHLCGQVCPTGAIPNLPLEEKKKKVIGVAVVDRNHCLPYAKRMNCIVCEEHCPIPEKAIRFETVRERDYAGKDVVLKKPYVVEELCNGCGICENKCPLEGKSAIEVFPQVRRRGRA